MKFMKLGSKPDTFHTAEAVRSVCSEVASDLIVQVKGFRYSLHKFPLLSKCLRLQRLCAESPDSSPHQIIQLPDFPGGSEAFELCAKFCYGITITLSAYNIVAMRCAAEYLQMTEEAEKGNLIYKLEVFLNSCILHGWKDAIVTLQSTKAFPAWSEELGITGRCIDAIASKVLRNPTKISLSHSYSKRGGKDDVVSCNGHGGGSGAGAGGVESARQKSSKGWWAEDVAELSIDLYWRTMIAIKSGGRVPLSLIGEALQIYAAKWLTTKQVIPDIESDTNGEKLGKYRLLLESIVSLLPSEKGAVSCSFLLKLLRAANLLNASSSSRVELARRVGMQLEEATVKDLLIPSSLTERRYDVDLFMAILEQYLSQSQSPPTSPPRTKGRYDRRTRSRSAEHINLEFQESRRSSSASHSSKLKVAKLVDGYLQEIAHDKSLPLSKMIAIAEAIPGFARIEHDDLYKAIDTYLKAHPELSKSERKRLCRVLDCKKLSVEACMHAAQNELLPLRVVVQVLFYEQARTAMAGGKVTDLPSNIKALLATQNDDSSRPGAALSTKSAVEDQWSVSGLKSPCNNISTLKMKLAEDDLEEHCGLKGGSKLKNLCSIPARPKRMFSKLLSMNKSTTDQRN
ncbi:hypothetical protein vseg_002189 [Gypsophila vaccaria]